VRRSSDNAEQDIGFSGGTLDTNALTSFVGSNDGYVVTWYDQSGNNRDATQSTQADQPKIVDQGSVTTDGNGVASIIFQNGNYLAAPWSALFSAPDSDVALFSVIDFIDTSNLHVPFRQTNGGEKAIENLNTIIHGYSSSSSDFYRVNDTDSSAYSLSSEFGQNTPKSIALLKSSGSALAYNNNTQKMNKSTADQQERISKGEGPYDIYIGKNAGFSRGHHNGHITEMVVYAEDKSSKRQLIQNNQMNRYRIQ
jgi:hypothetical protein